MGPGIMIQITCTRNQLCRLANSITAALNHDLPEFIIPAAVGWPDMRFIRAEDPNTVPKIDTSEEA